jgi:2-polyprenyl-3-methyl-5-hydroxy-6-metoxy-1,4-benzoquinol methylase
MPIRIDTEGNEIGALLNLAVLDGGDVLEVGCGDGRLPWRCAEKAGHVDAVDAFEESIMQANASLPASLVPKIRFHHSPLPKFAASRPPHSYDTIILAWSL